VRPPEEIAAECDYQAQLLEDHGAEPISRRLLREAAEALRAKLGVATSAEGTSYCPRCEELAADRDALLAVARAAEDCKAFLQGGDVEHVERGAATVTLVAYRKLRSALANLPEHLRRQVES
jgi:hypothetical protein